MQLLPREIDKLLLRQAGLLAQQRLSRGVQLNLPEATALVACVCLELMRDGKHSVETLMSLARTILGVRHVLPSVPRLLHEVQVEGTFRDGTKLLTVHEPISTRDGDAALAVYGSGLPPPPASLFPEPSDTAADPPGSWRLVEGREIELNVGRPRTALVVTNDGDRPIQVGSHYHFIETNAFLRFDRKKAYGKRLDIAAGTSVRFEPGDSRTVSLVEIAGSRCISGGNGIATGPIDPLDDEARIDAIVAAAVARGFRHEPQIDRLPDPAPAKMTAAAYASLFGPTVGDRVQLGDSALWIEIERDYTVYGDECVFGGGKVIRDGMGQSADADSTEALDLVITNAIILDYTGILKADIGVKAGRIVGIGKAGNPSVMAGVDPQMIIGATTEVLSGEHCIVTAGAVDTHVHYICTQLATEALAHGTTTLLGGGTGPNTGTNATTCTSGPAHIEMMMRATDDLPLNFGFTGKGNASGPAGLEAQVQAGAVGLKLHEDWGTTPAAIDCCLDVCEKYDVQATLHSDTLNEAGFVESTIAAFRGRTIHAYHAEGAGGGHCPDQIVVCGHPNVIPSSTNPTRPYTTNTVAEHLDMLMVCHHLNRAVPEDVAFAESRIRCETMGAEDVLQDMGAMSAISSDSQAMGRVGEVVTRAWQTADKAKRFRGPLPEDAAAGVTHDNLRAKRYVSKYTINPALAHGLAHLVGSVEVGKLADLVLYRPAFFGTKPHLVLKGGQIVWAMMGDPNASIPTPEPVYGRLQYAGLPSALGGNSVVFCSQASVAHVRSLGLRKQLEAVRGCRAVSKRDMKLNDLLPDIKVDPETYRVTVDGAPIDMAPADTVCMGQTYFLF